MPTANINWDILNSYTNTPAERLEYLRKIAPGIPQDMRSCVEVDLHCHSYYSDGYNSPSMRAAEAKRRGLKGFALTDHDVFDGVEEAVKAGEILGIEVVPGIEFYTTRPGVEILGYFPDKADFLDKLHRGVFAPLIESIRASKQEKLRAMAKRVPEAFARYQLDIEIVRDDIDRYLRNGISSTGDISVILWLKYSEIFKEKLHIPDIKAFHARFTSNYAEINVPLNTGEDLSMENLCRQVYDWGGLPFLPHPVELRNKEHLGNAALFEVIEKLGACHLQGIELDNFRNTICPECGRHQTDLLIELRQRYNQLHPDRLPLLASSGVDSHNQPGEGIEMGWGRHGEMRPELARLDLIRQMKERQKELFFS